MPRTESRTKTAIWSDDEFRKRSGRAQRMYWLLYSQPTISLCGVLALTERRWAATADDETLETVRASLDELEEHRYILVDWDTEEVLVRTFARHDGVKPKSTVWPAAWGQLHGIASPALRAAAERELRSIGTPPSGYTDTQLDTPSDTQVDGVVDTQADTPSLPLSVAGNTPSDTPSDGEWDTSRGRVPASSVSSLRLLPPSPSPAAHPEDGAPLPSGDVALRTETGDQIPGTDLRTAQAIAAACKGDNRKLVNTEAAAVATWALAKVDKRIIDEALGSFSDERPPVLPRVIAGIIRRKAADHRIQLEEFQP